MNEEEQNDIYILDTNVLLELERWIPIEIGPTFWDLLEKALKDGKWVLLDIIVEEIGYPATLVAWCKKQRAMGNVVKIDDSQRERGVEINRLFPMIDESSGRSEKDTYLIAYAEAYGLTVFSREGPKKPSESRYKIPDVCTELKVRSIRNPRTFYKLIGIVSGIFS